MVDFIGSLLIVIVFGYSMYLLEWWIKDRKK